MAKKATYGNLPLYVYRRSGVNGEARSRFYPPVITCGMVEKDDMDEMLASMFSPSLCNSDRTHCEVNCDTAAFALFLRDDWLSRLLKIA